MDVACGGPCSGVAVVLTDVLLTHNNGTSGGGAALNVDASSDMSDVTVTVTNVTAWNNTAGWAGLIFGVLSTAILYRVGAGFTR